MNTFFELNRFRHITFHDEGHRYVTGNRELRSVTQVISEFKKPFDRDGQAKRMAEKKNVDVEEILSEWDLKRNLSCEKGTLFHEFVEYFLANKAYTYPQNRVVEQFGQDPIKDSFEKLIQHFRAFYRDSSKNLIPVKSEVVIGDEEMGIAGMIDQIYFNQKSGMLEIWDWKTNKAIQKRSSFGQKMLAPIGHLDECEWHTYSLQLALYKHIIEKNTELRLGHSYIAWFHENNPTYQVFRCAPFQEEIRNLLRVFRDSNPA